MHAFAVGPRWNMRLPSVWDPSFLYWAVGVSCLGHALVAGFCSISREGAVFQRPRPSAPATPFKLVYERDPSEARSPWTAKAVQRVLTRHIVIPGPRGLSSRTPGGEAGRHSAESALLGSRMAAMVSVAGVAGGTRGTAGGGGAIDLTDVTAAAQGDPVRLAYFSAIREQVQRTADTQDRVSSHEDEGLVYVQFIIDRTGRIHSAARLEDRSRASLPLGDTAVRLVKASNPFPPFPPSFEESTLTVLLPIEFVSSAL